MLGEDVKWFVSTCHPFQTQQTHHLQLPLTIPDIPTLISKVHIDTMLIPTVNKFQYLVQACCALSSWPKWCPLGKENAKTLGDLISTVDGVEWLKLLLTMAKNLWLQLDTYPRNTASITSIFLHITPRPMALSSRITSTYMIPS